jgi:hypothetical protein
MSINSFYNYETHRIDSYLNHKQIYYLGFGILREVNIGIRHNEFHGADGSIQNFYDVGEVSDQFTPANTDIIAIIRLTDNTENVRYRQYQVEDLAKTRRNLEDKERNLQFWLFFIGQFGGAIMVAYLVGRLFTFWFLNTLLMYYLINKFNHVKNNLANSYDFSDIPNINKDNSKQVVPIEEAKGENLILSNKAHNWNQYLTLPNPEMEK